MLAHSGSAFMNHKERATQTWKRIMPSDEKQYMLDRTNSHTWTVLHEGQLVPFYSWEVQGTAVNDSNDLEKLRFFPWLSL